MFTDCGHPCFRNFDYTFSVDVIWMKSYADGLVWVTINKLNLVPNWKVSGYVSFQISGLQGEVVIACSSNSSM